LLSEGSFFFYRFDLLTGGLVITFGLFFFFIDSFYKRSVHLFNLFYYKWVFSGGLSGLFNFIGLNFSEKT